MEKTNKLILIEAVMKKLILIEVVIVFIELLTTLFSPGKKTFFVTALTVCVVNLILICGLLFLEFD